MKYLDRTELIVYDFDGVMTDNKVYVDQNGNEIVQVSRADGLGVSEIKKLSIKQIIISTEINPVVSTRACKLDIPFLLNVDNKKEVLMDYCHNYKIDLNKVVFVGNDINDKEAMEIVGTTFCPSDAHESIKSIVDHVLEKKGGEGVIRELFDYILINKGD